MSKLFSIDTGSENADFTMVVASEVTWQDVAEIVMRDRNLLSWPDDWKLLLEENAGEIQPYAPRDATQINAALELSP